MRMRFCATMRRPAFSITALTAPVRLRAVASGLMIEKVRSMAMILSLRRSGDLELRGLYRRRRRTASDGRNGLTGASPQARFRGFQHGLPRFHPDEPNLKAPFRAWFSFAGVELAPSKSKPDHQADSFGGLSIDAIAPRRQF